MQTKKIPERSCIGCKEKKPKRELIRIVRTKEGSVEVDFTGRKSGRGAYICNSVDCLNKAKKSRALSRALECEIPSEVYERLEGELSKNE
ncbi:MAG: YlxR family protein [Oscillospiraceae bacterium]|nr:YlxR family protein [Oscillospiraceae bacterium]